MNSLLETACWAALLAMVISDLQVGAKLKDTLGLTDILNPPLLEVQTQIPTEADLPTEPEQPEQPE